MILVVYIPVLFCLYLLSSLILFVSTLKIGGFLLIELLLIFVLIDSFCDSANSSGSSSDSSGISFCCNSSSLTASICCVGSSCFFSALVICNSSTGTSVISFCVEDSSKPDSPSVEENKFFFLILFPLIY